MDMENNNNTGLNQGNEEEDNLSVDLEFLAEPLAQMMLNYVYLTYDV